jgi:hypothetical protein
MSHLNIGSIWAIGRSCSCRSEKHVRLQVIDAHSKTGGTNLALNPALAVRIVEELMFRVSSAGWREPTPDQPL